MDLFEGVASFLNGNVGKCSICKREDTDFMLTKKEELVCFECKERLEKINVVGKGDF